MAFENRYHERKGRLKQEYTPFDPTGVTAGTPGEFTPAGCTIPATIGDLRALGLLESGTDAAWSEGEYVVIGSGNVHWDGTDWAMGAAPAP